MGTVKGTKKGDGSLALKQGVCQGKKQNELFSVLSHWAPLNPKRKAGRKDPADAASCSSLRKPKGRERWKTDLTSMGQEDKMLTDVNTSQITEILRM